MYKALYQYGIERNLVQAKYRAPVQMDAKIVLAADGTYIRTDMFTDKNKNETGNGHLKKKFETLSAEGGNSGAAVWGSGRDVLFPSENVKKSFAKRRENFLSLIAEAAKEIPAAQAIVDFMKHLDSDADFEKTVREDVMKVCRASGSVTFEIRMDGDKNICACDLSSPFAVWWDARMSKKEADLNAAKAAKKGAVPCAVSCVTGSYQPVVANKFPVSIKMNNAPLASFSETAFRSYGWDDTSGRGNCSINLNVPMSDDEARVIAKVLSYLREEGHCNEYFEFFYWYDETLPDEMLDVVGLATSNLGNKFIKEHEVSDDEQRRLERKKRRKQLDKPMDKLKADEDYSDAYRELLNTVFNGEALKSYYNVNLYLLDFKSSQGRMRVYNFRRCSYGDVYNSLSAWRKDTQIDSSNYKRRFSSAWAVLQMFEPKSNSSGNKEKKSVSEKFSMYKKALVNAVLFGNQIPFFFYKKALKLVEKRMISNDKVSLDDYMYALCLIKCYLLRTGKEEYFMNENLEMPANLVAYTCGRWFATMVKLQKDAIGDVGSDLTVRYYKSVKTKPAVVFSNLSNKRMIYLKKLEKDPAKKAWAVRYHHIFAELGELIGTSFPLSFDMLEMGAFDLGYCYQNNLLYQKADKSKTSDVTVGEDTDIVAE